MPNEALDTDTLIKLIRTLGHDIRGTIAVITSTSEMLSREMYGSLTPGQSRANERIQRNSKRLVALINDFTGYVKAEAGQYPVVTRAFKVGDIFENLIKHVQPYLSEYECDIQTCITDPVPTTLCGDSEMIEEILQALLWNAITFTGSGTVRIQASWTGTNHLTIDVEDHGPGISPEDQAHLFTPFWRGVNRPKAPTAGAGLSLAKARAFVTLLNGQITLASTGPTGSVFRLELPLTPVESN
ncbi:MAG: HAMP domain-containing histidine kinase [Anaerolineae bacterium]|nr:HAMP domain-containing histidine kinase [Anaerolineae bacterium]